MEIKLGGEIAPALISALVEKGFEGVKFHDPIEGVRRFVPEGFPLHIGVHRVEGVDAPEADYVRRHSHDSGEINLVLAPEGELAYRLTLGGEERVVEAPFAIWIPPGVEHSASAVRGTGYFVCIILEGK